MAIIRQKKEAFQTLMESVTNSYSVNHKMQLWGPDHLSVLQDKNSFQQLIEAFTDEFDSGEDTSGLENFVQVANTSRQEVLRESYGGFNPISALTLPILRKTFPKMVIPQVVPTQALEVPKITTLYMRPYIRVRNPTTDELVKRYLPEALYENDNTYALRKKIHNEFFDINTPVNLIDEANLTTANNDYIDTDVCLEAVKMTVKDAAGANPEVITVSNLKDFKMDTKTNIINARIEGKHSTNHVNKDTLFVTVDRLTGAVESGSTSGLITEIKVEGWIATSFNNQNEEVGYDLEHKDTEIPTAPHLSYPLPQEVLMDQLKIYNIDAIGKAVDIMSSIIASRVDMDGFRKLDSTKITDQWERQFNCHPYSNFTGSPTDWKKEIRGVIDNLASEMINGMQIGSFGTFVIIGNPVDTSVIPEINWTFSYQDTESSGVRVDYSVGSARGAYNYTIVSSEKIAKGSLRMVYIPAGEDYKTYMFYPYSFTISKGEGYLNVNTPNVPAIVAHRRYAYENFIRSAIGTIRILNNNGTFPS